MCVFASLTGNLNAKEGKINMHIALRFPFQGNDGRFLICVHMIALEERAMACDLGRGEKVIMWHPAMFPSGGRALACDLGRGGMNVAFLFVVELVK